MSRRRIVILRTRLIAVAILAVSACGGIQDSHDVRQDAARVNAVSDKDPLPVPPDTMGPPDVDANKLAVGAIVGHSEISDDGAAHYSIPLWVPPGRAGMQPDEFFYADKLVGALDDESAAREFDIVRIDFKVVGGQ